MKLLFVVNLKEEIKSGLFIAIHNRIKVLKDKYNIDVEVYSIGKHENLILKILTKHKNKSKFSSKEYFYYENIKYNMLYYKDTLLKSVGRKLGIDTYLKNTTKKIKDIKSFDLVVAHWAHPPGSLAYYIKKKFSIPFTLTLHGSDVHTMPNQNIGYRKFLKRNLNSADSVFFVSKSLKDHVNTINLNPNTFVSYNGVDNNVFFPLPKTEIKKFKDSQNFNDTVVGYVGDLRKIKRSDWLIDIFINTQMKYEKQITFLIIGDGKLKEQIIKDSKRTEIDVRVIGRVDQNQLRDYYNSMNCLILPSREEGLGNVILEAQACGTPVVATKTGGVPEIIDNKNFLVTNNDENIISEFSEKVNKILISGYKSHQEELTWNQIVENELEVYKRIIKKINNDS